MTNYAMLALVTKYFTVFLFLTSIVHADYWRFTLNKYECIVPREWQENHFYFRMNMVTTTSDGNIKQNETTDRGGSSLVREGAKSDEQVMWKDITLGEGDANLLFTFTAWNRGDEDPQKVGFGECLTHCPFLVAKCRYSSSHV